MVNENANSFWLKVGIFWSDRRTKMFSLWCETYKIALISTSHSLACFYTSFESFLKSYKDILLYIIVGNILYLFDLFYISI